MTTHRRIHAHARLAAALLAAAGATGLLAAPPDEAPARAPALASAPVTASAAAGTAGYDGTVQAVRQSVLAAQVPGAVVALPVKAGDAVKAGQVLVRLDARAARQGAEAGAAQVRAADASLEAAEREFARQKQLFERKYISQAALERAEAQFKAARAGAAAQLAQADAARTQADVHVIRAPYAGIVSEVAVVLGDMAMPGRPLVTLYDPAVLRVSAALPQAVAARLGADAPVAVDIPGSARPRLQPVRTQLLPAVDPATHTQELRLELPGGLQGVTPGMFARAWVPGADPAGQRLFVPDRAIVRRAELSAVYVIGPDGKALLRQVRTGRADGGLVEILSGVSAGERVALEPQAASALR